MQSLLTKHIDKKAFIFSFDDVIFHARDYDIQVFYLFGQFIEFTFPHIQDGKRIVYFMILKYPEMSRMELIDATIQHFNIPEEYKNNYLRLFGMAQLPLKLIMFNDTAYIIQKLKNQNKQLFIIADGDVSEQINKIKQLEWNGLEQYIKIYFAQEFGSSDDTIKHIIKENSLPKEDIIIINNKNLI